MVEGFGLFFGALFDALIGPNLFVPGEPFFLAAGYQLFQGIWTGVIAVVLGAWLGDQLSYLAGRRFGLSGQKRLVRWQPKLRRVFARCRLLLHKRANYILVFSRLLGPLAWVVPFIAGSYKVTWSRFSLFSMIGLILGVGQFVLWGYLLALGVGSFTWWDTVWAFAQEHWLLLVSAGASLLCYWYGRRKQWRFTLLKSSAVFVLGVAFANYSYFFWYADDNIAPQSAAVDVFNRDLSSDPSHFKVYAGQASYFNAQPINVAYVGDNPADLMRSLGWIENKTFSRNEIEWKDYLALLKASTPPVSDLFWRGVPQESAYQRPGDLLTRSHIRWWQSGLDSATGERIWLGAVSYDDGLKITPYSGIVTILHSIDPNVDKERDLLAQSITGDLKNGWEMGYYSANSVAVLDKDHDYFSDGRVLVVGKSLTQTQLAANVEIAGIESY
ncbi:LssY C-terminal domain-containing protein [Vibrio sp. TRT 17S01]|uniref:LssY C-terminal domain-containing protein n=1 Tax=Vibrio sp. TRT 17S01 TaxID=3418505 RepID=UPI003CEF8E17